MKDSSQGIGTRVIVLVTVAGCVLAGFALCSRRPKDTRELARLQRDLSVLKAEFDAQQERLLVLESSFQISRQSGGPVPLTADSLGPRDEDLAKWIAESARIQSNTAALLERLTATLPPPPSRQQTQARYAVIEAEAARERQQLDDLKRKAADLLTNLQVPDEIAALDPASALDSQSLRPYWPFFEVKRERDQKQHFVNALELKLLAQRVEGQQ